MNRFIFFLVLFFLFNNLVAKQSDWDFVIPDRLQKPTRSYYAQRLDVLFAYFLRESLTGAGEKDFLNVTKSVRNRIFWKQNKDKQNVFIDAFDRSYPIIKHYKLPEKVPAFILLIPYIESLWRAKAGHPAKDYGYWQLIPSIVIEIKKLPSTPAYLKKKGINSIRSNHKLSTAVALIHLQRYYFYFHHVAKFNKIDAWLFSMISYNWGVGNVKRTLLKMKKDKLSLSFSTFYHHLYQRYKKKKTSRSLRSAVEYLPHLWNILQVIRQR
jgi:hypothetical protein